MRYTCYVFTDEIELAAMLDMFNKMEENGYRLETQLNSLNKTYFVFRGISDVGNDDTSEKTKYNDPVKALSNIETQITSLIREYSTAARYESMPAMKAEQECKIRGMQLCLDLVAREIDNV